MLHARLLSLGWLVAALSALGCDFSPGIADYSDAGIYPPCESDQDCLETCVCLGGSICVPIERGDTCARECDEDADCQTGAQNAEVDCSRGRCWVLGCTAPYLDCDGQAANGCESDPAADEANCGGCVGEGGVACDVAAGEVCGPGGCTFDPCAAGWNDCDGDSSCESDPLSDPQNCGGCAGVGGISCLAQPGVEAAVCAGGACVVLSCLGEFHDCNLDGSDGCESDGLTDPDHCGGCAGAGGEACQTASGYGCSDGSCVLDPCLVWNDCDGDDVCESDPDTDPANCGGCAGMGGLDCLALPNVLSATCLDGVCQLTCTAHRADCNGGADGCETDIRTSSENCGGCVTEDGTACDTTLFQTCADGVCVTDTCGFGWNDCDGSPLNSCESDPANDELNCGACVQAGGRACDPFTSECIGGQCSCLQGYAACDPEGPCVLLGTIYNCSECGDNCAELDGVDPLFVGCSAEGQCVVFGCLEGRGDCDGESWNGCEANLHSDLGHCGNCTTACNPLNVVAASCDMGTCGYQGGCLPGYADCDLDGRNGCEANLSLDPLNCNACGRACPAITPVCKDGACVTMECAPGFAECDDNDGTMCETTLGTLEDCLYCGNNCWTQSAYYECNQGQCYPECAFPDSGCTYPYCPPGHLECDNILDEPAELCETLESALQCGSCNHDCWIDQDFWANQTGTSTFPTCADGYCQPATCEPPLAECDRQPEACETQLGTVTDCGGCGLSCEMYQVALCNMNPSCTMVCAGYSCEPFFCPEGTLDCNFEDNIPCETVVGTQFNCDLCGGRCPAGQVCVNGICKQGAVARCGGVDCLPGEVCCLDSGTTGQSERCVSDPQASGCDATGTCAGPADCPGGQYCCTAAMNSSFACRPSYECWAEGILCSTPADCPNQDGTANCCANDYLFNLMTCRSGSCITL